jgi:hypothetical protein
MGEEGLKIMQNFDHNTSNKKTAWETGVNAILILK